MKSTLEERFHSKYIKKGHNECWEWIACVNKFGYGRIHTEGRNVSRKAHIVAWEFANGKQVPSGMCVCHKCDNPSCVNPAHLFLGTVGINNLDMRVKGRHWETNKTHCPQGHEYTEENTYLGGPNFDRRNCRICRRASNVAYRQRKAAC